MCYSAYLSIDVHYSTHLKKNTNFLIKPFIKIIQMHCTPSFLFILLFQTCHALSKALKCLLFFFIISRSLIKLSSLRSFSSALISLQSQSRRRHQPQSQPSPSPAHRRRCRSTVLSQALKPLFFFIISSSHLSASPSPSQPSPAHAVRAHASARRRPSPHLSSSPSPAHFRSVLSPLF